MDADVRRVITELGNPSLEPLWLALKRRGLAGRTTKKELKAHLQRDPAKQTLAPPQRALGKTISEDENRWQADLVDLIGLDMAGRAKHLLVCVSAFDRYIYAEPLRDKTGSEVAEHLKRILDRARKKPQVLSSDNGPEFAGEVKRLLEQRDIVQKFKDVGDLNALGLLDRQIGLLKRKLTEMHLKNGKSWTANLSAAVSALNNTPKPGVLHGAAPAEVDTDPEVKFMLYQDQARAIQQNARVTKKRTAALEGATFRPQLAITRFKRNYQATYGDRRRATKVEAGRVHTAGGETFPLKTIKVVPTRLRRAA